MILLASHNKQNKYIYKNRIKDNKYKASLYISTSLPLKPADGPTSASTVGPQTVS